MKLVLCLLLVTVLAAAVHGASVQKIQDQSSTLVDSQKGNEPLKRIVREPRFGGGFGGGGYGGGVINGPQTQIGGGGGVINGPQTQLGRTRG